MPLTTSKDAKPHKPLRQLAVEKTQGKGANPSLLGDPISLAIETTSDDTPGNGNHSASTQHSNTAEDTANQTKRDPVDHDNGPSGTSGSVTKGRPSSKL